jgi:2,4-dienoyl-CoA reductase (NADPH2)
MLGRDIAVIGGGAVGLETAHFLAVKGTLSPETVHFLLRHDAETCDRLKELVHIGTKNVTVFEMLPKVGNGIGRSTKWVVLGNLESHGVKTIAGAKVLSVKNGRVTFEKNGKTESIQFDNVINAAGSKSIKKIADMLPSLGIPFAVAGDTIKPAQINDAIHGGFFAAMEIDKK